MLEVGMLEVEQGTPFIPREISKEIDQNLGSGMAPLKCIK